MLYLTAGPCPVTPEGPTGAPEEGARRELADGAGGAAGADADAADG